MFVLLAEGGIVRPVFSRLLDESQTRYRKGKYGH